MSASGSGVEILSAAVKPWRSVRWSPVSVSAVPGEEDAKSRCAVKDNLGSITHASGQDDDETKPTSFDPEPEDRPIPPPVPPRPPRLNSASSAPGIRSRFSVDHRINEILKIMQGPPRVFVDLRVDALVNLSNSRLDDWSGEISGEILARAGRMLPEECSQIPSRCQVGEAKITAGCLLAATYVIHTVAPKFVDQYKTAAESSLHSCYKSILSICKEQNLRSVALPILFTPENGFPRETGAHIAVRTIRRFLEHFTADFDHVVLYLGESMQDYDYFTRALAMYCPRSAAEELWATANLPQDTGNEWGEIEMEDRRIRISSSIPSAMTTVNGKYMPAGRPGPPPTPPARVYTEVVYGVDTLVDNLLYSSLLERAGEQDFKDMVAYNIIYRGGTDPLGRPIVVIAAANLSASIPEDRLLMYFAHTCDKLSRHPKGFVVVFLDHPDGAANLPSLSWFKSNYEDVIGRKYKKNLRRMYVVHPTWQLKAHFWAAMPFVSTKFWDKFFYLDTLEELFRYIPADCILLPAVALRRDKELQTDAMTSWFSSSALSI